GWAGICRASPRDCAARRSMWRRAEPTRRACGSFVREGLKSPLYSIERERSRGVREMKIRQCVAEDLSEWMRMRLALWPEIASDVTQQEVEATDLLARKDAVVLVAESPSGGGLAGFAE